MGGETDLVRKRARLRIAVADDDRRMLQFYAEVLSRMGHEVVGCAADAKELIAACLSRDIDIVITDIKMPGMSGIEAARIITATVAVPFLFVSAYHDEDLIARASMPFGYGYLVKPIKQEDLATSIPIAVQRFREQLRS